MLRRAELTGAGPSIDLYPYDIGTGPELWAAAVFQDPRLTVGNV